MIKAHLRTSRAPSSQFINPSNFVYRRLLLSQDRHEIYLTIAEYDSNYIDYLRGNQRGLLSFLAMNEFGPWDCFDHLHIESLAEILVAFTPNCS